MAKNFIFTITTGRTGTAYLAELLQSNLSDITAHHEIFNFLAFGGDTPDVRQLAHFNTLGNIKIIRDFWQNKLTKIQKTPTETYAETSHVLAKAGLMENLHLLYDNPENQVHIIILKRDMVDIAWSMLNRFDFSILGATLLFYLHQDYKNIIIKPDIIEKLGLYGNILWYINEMYTRAAYYQLLYQDIPNLHFHEATLKEIISEEGAKHLLNKLALPTNERITIPGKLNEQTVFLYNESNKKELQHLCSQIAIDYIKLAQQYIQSGQSLGEPMALRQRFRDSGYEWED